MTVYARSDIAAVNISSAHGGCGWTHSRPVVDGAPARLWSLDCVACEDHLRNDPLWASSPADIPETHNEKLDREDFEKRGARDKDAVMTLAVARLAGVDPENLPESLTRMISGVKAHVPATRNCPNGHPNPVDQKFCGECGMPVGATLDAAANITVTAGLPAAVTAEPVVPPAPPPVVAADPEPPAKVSLPSNTKMRGMKREDLEQLAADAGLSTGGSRQDILNRLLEYNKA